LLILSTIIQTLRVAQSLKPDMYKRALKQKHYWQTEDKSKRNQSATVPKEVDKATAQTEI